jgi:fumarate hydratase subunit beta
MRHGAVYLAAIGGAGAFYGRLVKRVSVVAWPELGPEALAFLEVEDFPVVVVHDLEGGDLYRSGPMAFDRRPGPPAPSASGLSGAS